MTIDTFGCPPASLAADGSDRTWALHKEGSSLRRLVSTLRINSCVLLVSSNRLFRIARNSIYQETSQVNTFNGAQRVDIRPEEVALSLSDDRHGFHAARTTSRVRQPQEGCYEPALSVPTGSIRAHGTVGV